MKTVFVLAIVLVTSAGCGRKHTSDDQTGSKNGAHGVTTSEYGALPGAGFPTNLTVHVRQPLEWTPPTNVIWGH